MAVFPPADGPLNFALDDALLANARETGRELIRLYSWSRPTVSFGRNERVEGRFSPERLVTAGITPVRRRTGGRALLHHRELTYAIAGEIPAGESLTVTFKRVQDLLVDALRVMGVGAEVAGKGKRGSTLAESPCFAEPSPGELVVDGRKLVAGAQWREGNWYLQHGSILIDDDQGRIREGLVDARSFVSPPAPATLRGLLGRVPDIEELAEAVEEALARRGATGPIRTEPKHLVGDSDIDRLAAHYRDPVWTWRR